MSEGRLDETAGERDRHPPPGPPTSPAVPGQWQPPVAAPTQWPSPPPPEQGQLPQGWGQPPYPDQAPGGPAAPLAGWWARVGASIIDTLVIVVPLAVCFVVLFVVTGVGSEDFNSETDDIPPIPRAFLVGLLVLFVIWFVVALLYPGMTMSRKGGRNGQTLGKQLLGIRVLRDDGQPVSFGFALLREVVIKGLLVGQIGGFLLYIPVLLNYLWPLWDESSQALHDKLVKTHVVVVAAPSVSASAY